MDATGRFSSNLYSVFDVLSCQVLTGVLKSPNTATFIMNLSPFTRFGIVNFGLALVLIFWAYAGFEISTILAEEIGNQAEQFQKT